MLAFSRRKISEWVIRISPYRGPRLHRLVPLHSFTVFGAVGKLSPSNQSKGRTMSGTDLYVGSVECAKQSSHRVGSSEECEQSYLSPHADVETIAIRLFFPKSLGCLR